MHHREVSTQYHPFSHFKKALCRTLCNCITIGWRNCVSSIMFSILQTGVASILNIRGTLPSLPLQMATELGSLFKQVSCGSGFSPHFSSVKSARERGPISLSSAASYNSSFSSFELHSALNLHRGAHEGPRMLEYFPLPL